MFVVNLLQLLNFSYVSVVATRILSNPTTILKSGNPTAKTILERVALLLTTNRSTLDNSASDDNPSLKTCRDIFNLSIETLASPNKFQLLTYPAFPTLTS